MCICDQKIVLGYLRNKCDLLTFEPSTKAFTTIYTVRTPQMTRSLRVANSNNVLSIDRLGNLTGYRLVADQLIETGGCCIGDVCRKFVGIEDTTFSYGVTGSITRMRAWEIPEAIAEELKKFQQSCLVPILGKILYGKEHAFTVEFNENKSFKDFIVVDLFALFTKFPSEVKQEWVKAFNEAAERKEGTDITQIISNFLTLFE